MAVEIFTQPVDKNFMREFTRMEFKCLLDFAKSAKFYYADSRNQLRDLWTAYCLHHDAYMDTKSYDKDLYEIWSGVLASHGDPKDTPDWASFETFDIFMGEHLD